MEKDFTPSFTDLRRDADRYADLTCEKGEIMGTPAIFGYDEAEDAVFRAYLEAEAYDAVIHFLLTERSYEWGLNDRFLQVIDILLGKRHAARLTRLWSAAIATQKQFFWENLAHRDLPDMEKTVAKTKAGALDTMERFAAILEQLGQDATLRRLRDEIAALREERREKPHGKPDPRTMTEDLFWELIEAAEGESPDERVAVLTDLLARFKATQIKAFDTLLWQVMDTANHHDLWALAFLAQDGCSDDAFEYFRAWLVLQGRAAFDMALNDPVGFLATVPVGTHSATESLLRAPAIAYELRAGKALKPKKLPLSRVKGEAWEEADLTARYPDLARRIADIRQG